MVVVPAGSGACAASYTVFRYVCFQYVLKVARRDINEYSSSVYGVSLFGDHVVCRVSYI